ncbi:HAD family hydrolase [Ferrimonas sediminicola]|uniref:HAD family hydrolase n=1 Tax=Ferrimonas sediminicola TaxID=2569538 RepID=A0A4U1BBW5_9GAMM|nr:HAD-IA family hydrolase [Ferrimonas sediminicola]TKB48304.1 HAD family hydrolase [Ferrimonas sediminicola]
MSRCDLVIFDWDGTLMDSVDRIVDSWQRACAELSMTVNCAESVRSIIGLSIESAVAALIPDLPPERLEPFVRTYRSWYLERSDVPTPLFDGAEPLLHELKGRGYRLAVATGKGRPGLERVLDASGLRPLFDASRTPTEAASKPHPDMILQLCTELDCQPNRAVMVGDALFDLEMANRAGAIGVGVSYGAGSEDVLRSASPKGIIHHPMELLNLL